MAISDLHAVAEMISMCTMPNLYKWFVLFGLVSIIWRPQWHSWMCRPTEDQEVAGSTPRRGRQHSFVEIDHEIFSTVILSLQEGQLSVSGERVCTILVNCLED